MVVMYASSVINCSLAIKKITTNSLVNLIQICYDLNEHAVVNCLLRICTGTREWMLLHKKKNTVINQKHTPRY